MTLMPEIHDALARAVATRPGRRRWWHPSRRAGLLAAGALIITGSAFAATGDWHPILGDDHRGHPQAARAPAPREQVAALGVLRREQTDADRGPDVQAVLRLLSRETIHGVHTDGIRVLRRDPNGVTILVPIERVGNTGHPGSLLHDVLCVMRTVTPTQPVTFKDRSGKLRQMPAIGGAGSTCGDVRQLRTTGIGWSNGRLVPDGVARVVVRLRHHRYVNVAVHDNYYDVDTGGELLPAWGVRWLDAQGHTVDHRRTRHPK